MNNTTNVEKLLISARYWLLGMAEHDERYFTVIAALEMGYEHHNGKRNGGDHEFTHQLKIFHYLRTLHRHLKNPVTVYILAFLHDAIEDPNQKTKKHIDPKDLVPIFGEEIVGKIVKMSKSILGQPNLNYSLAAIFDDEDMSIAKGGDRVDNVRSMMGVFKRERLERYIKETMEEFIPRIKHSRRKFAYQESVYENFKMELLGTISLIGHILEGYVPDNTLTAPPLPALGGE